MKNQSNLFCLGKPIKSSGIAFLCWILLAGISCQQQKVRTASLSATPVLYTCPMHPRVREDHPGNCPICGMKLIPVNKTFQKSDSLSLENLLTPANEYVRTTLPVTTAQERDLTVPLMAYGTIEYDTRAARAISSRVSGRIDKLYVRYRYQQVYTGEKLMEIYSPELLTAQQDLLFLLKKDPGNEPFIQAAKEKLRLLGMSDPALRQIIHSGEPMYEVGIYSNYSGHVHDAGMGTSTANNDMINQDPLTQELALKEGMYIQKGETLFMIMDHRKAWASLQIFPDDLSLVKTGTPVTVVPEADTTASFQGTINFIEPFYRTDEKTLTARVYFDNTRMLPIGSQVTASLVTHTGPALWIPLRALRTLGLQQIVFIRSGGQFQAHRVSTGEKSGPWVQITKGLTVKDTLAEDASYLVDPESFIKTSLKK